ncbi:hypothetical protein BCR32DRAFT_290519 [Anaeromyces robustus]|uniref:Purple acid phosphatase n=1 Tax=Anaeromyces robustus TaxID=1754192 RepID=A0A1Y1XJ06_9FUNG|nr:hypothetical protein BCR32DRAFT_290519 [Anaeromyces robustus]|eukprot:ORX85735.1 hypothetical protein BCR32DRAFT_290519 [Anaeromyces robustus]
MKKIAILLSLLLTHSKISLSETTECWSTEYGYPCCSSPDTKSNSTDSKGTWGFENGDWCGLAKAVVAGDFCWADELGFSCCENDNGKIVIGDNNGLWGKENGNWCGFKNGFSWNDRDRKQETKEEWENFKVKWDNEYKNNFERISVFAGEDESMLNFGWYSTTETEPVIRFGSNEDMSNAKEFIGTREFAKALDGKNYYSNKVVVTGLERNSIYYYQRKLNNEWDRPVQFRTQDPKNFKFIFVGDPQIGGSNNHRTFNENSSHLLTVPEGTRNDAFNWNMTIYNSFKLTREPSLLMSAGDQADSECFNQTLENLYNQETQFSALLLPEILQTIPSAFTVGNHESHTESFKFHFNTPNTYRTTECESDSGLEICNNGIYDYDGPFFSPGYSYFFKFNNVLVVVLETNFNTCNDLTTVISNAVEKYKDIDWRIAMFHHDIYGNGQYHSQEPYITDVLRPCLTELFDKNKFDLVINGHDHVYTTSHFVAFSDDSYGKYAYDINEIKKDKVYKNPKGTLYITANCSTGSKLYNYIPETPDYVYYYNQTYTSTFGVLDFKKEGKTPKLSITTYDVETLEVTDGPYIIEKPDTKKINIFKWIFIILGIIILLLLLYCIYIDCFKRERRNDFEGGGLTSAVTLNSLSHLNNNNNNNNNIDANSSISSISRHSSLEGHNFSTTYIPDNNINNSNHNINDNNSNIINNISSPRPTLQQLQSSPPPQISSFANMPFDLNNKNLSEMNISSIDDIQNDISAIPIPPNSTSTQIPSTSPSSPSSPSSPKSPISPLSPLSPKSPTSPTSLKSPISPKSPTSSNIPISPSSHSSKDRTSTYRQKNFFDAGGNVEFNKDIYLRTLNKLRNNQYIGYINPIERQEREKNRLSSGKRYSNNTNNTNTNTSINNNSITISNNLSKSPEMVPLKSFDNKPSKSFTTHPSRSFDVQPSNIYLNRPYKSFDSQPENSYVKYPSKSINNSQSINSYASPQTYNSSGNFDLEPHLNISLEGIEENEQNLEINPVNASGMVISKDELNNKLNVNSLSKIEEPDISLGTIDETNFSLNSNMPNISNIDNQNIIQDMDISLSSVGQLDGEATTEVGNIVESSFNFGVKKNNSNNNKDKRISQESQTSSGGLISSPSLSSQLVSSPKLINASSPGRTAFGLKRTSPLYLNQGLKMNNSSSNSLNGKKYLQTNAMLANSKQTYINVTSPKKSSTSFEKDENNNNNNMRINLNNFNEDEFNKIKIDKNNVDEILL